MTVSSIMQYIHFYCQGKYEEQEYQNRGQKEGAVKAMKKLETDGFGELKKKEMHHGTSAVSHM